MVRSRTLPFIRRMVRLKYIVKPVQDLDEKFNEFCDRINEIKTHVKYHNGEHDSHIK